ncbi:MAG: flotillin-like protein FloA [Thermoguttaceae bacterium]|nr:flotillin-like protein FloA [Thermoguttaceae bacterium]MDW8079965.1 flotillin-like protein FloA [Thermoguttaceae bacterium]
MVIVALLVLVGIILWIHGPLWFRAYMCRANVSMLSLIGMSLRGVDAKEIVDCKIMAVQAGLGPERETGITTSRLEGLYLAGGKVRRVIQAVIAAKRAGIKLSFDQAAAIDLAGRDVLDAVRTSVHPKVIDCPAPRPGEPEFLSAIARDGIELRVRARVTVRTNLERLIGGATEETIIARVGQGIITAIGSSPSHKEVLENPDRISEAVLRIGLDSQTAFEIVSIDIADIDVGENIGARLRERQAQADMQVANARAERFRALAVAQEAENRAEVVRMLAERILAEAQVPLALAESFRRGRLTVGSDASPSPAEPSSRSGNV